MVALRAVRCWSVERADFFEGFLCDDGDLGVVRGVPDHEQQKGFFSFGAVQNLIQESHRAWGVR